MAPRDRAPAAARRERGAARPRGADPSRALCRPRGVDRGRLLDHRRKANRATRPLRARASTAALADRFVGMYVNEPHLRLRGRGAPGGVRVLRRRPRRSALSRSRFGSSSSAVSGGVSRAVIVSASARDSRRPPYPPRGRPRRPSGPSRRPRRRGAVRGRRHAREATPGQCLDVSAGWRVGDPQGMGRGSGDGGANLVGSSKGPMIDRDGGWASSSAATSRTSSSVTASIRPRTSSRLAARRRRARSCRSALIREPVSSSPSTNEPRAGPCRGAAPRR